MKTFSLRLFASVLCVLLLSCQQGKESAIAPEPPSQLLIYSGITMVKPLQKIASEFSASHQVDITIIQGASGFIIDTLKKQQSGDLYFPGSSNFRQNPENQALFLSYVLVGYNRLALIVPKGNPKQLNAKVEQLANPELSVVISSPEASSVGRATDALLKKLHIENSVFENVTYFTTDSHRIFDAIRTGHADIAVNWYATSKWPESIDYMDALIVDEALSPKRRLEINLLRFSQNQPLARQFMEYASSEKGLRIFAEYGFLTDEELEYFLQNPPKILPASE